MTRYARLRERVLSGRSDANIDFDDLRWLLDHLDFAERTRGSHHVFVKSGVRDMIKLQRQGRLAKPYQVRQVRRVITAYGLGTEEDE